MIENMLERINRIFEEIANLLLNDKNDVAREYITKNYPHNEIKINNRNYTVYEKMKQFMDDGFIDRYTGERLVNPGILKILSNYYPNEFPYHPHWKTNKTHIAYWETVPTIDHIVPIARGGEDNKDNWVTTTMKNNLIKNNYTLEEVHWMLYPKGSIEEWDGLTKTFIKLVEKDRELLKDTYIRSWYNASIRVYESVKVC